MRLAPIVAAASGLLAALVTATAPLPAQRAKPSTAWGRRTVEIDHGKPAFGKHSLEELRPGTTWRLGNNLATVLRTQTPLLADNRIIAPGEYRVAIYRAQDGERFMLQVDHAGWAIGQDRAAIRLPATLEITEPSKRLEIKWQKAPRDGQSVTPDPNGHMILQAQFGPNRLDVPMTLLGSTKAGKLRGWKLTAFQVPEAVLKARLGQDEPTVVGSLHPRRAPSDREAPPFFNVVVRQESIALVPALRAPVSSFGFGKLERLDTAWTTESALEWADGDDQQPFFTIPSAALKKRVLTLTCAWGAKTAAASLRIPTGPKR